MSGSVLGQVNKADKFPAVMKVYIFDGEGETINETPEGSKC